MESVTKIENSAFWGCVNLKTIRGYAGSYAESYAKEYGYIFEDVEGKITTSYRTHVQSFGWQNPVTNGAMSGTSGEAMLMCGKVTHKNLIDSSPLFRKNIISKPSRASQRQVNGLSPTVDSPVCPCWWIIKGRQQKVLPPFPIIKERERLHD